MQTEKHTATFRTRNEAHAYFNGVRKVYQLVRDRDIWLHLEAPENTGTNRWAVHMYSAPREA